MAESIVKNKAFQFSVNSIHLYRSMIEEKEFVISKQFIRSATSIGANINEALAGISKKDFTAKMSIASKEAREARYWLELMQATKFTMNDLTPLLNEVEDLIKILTKMSVFK